MSTVTQASLSEALSFEASASGEDSLSLPGDIGFGEVSVGGFIASVMQRYALSYASQHPKLQHQVDLRSSYVNSHRPIFPAQGPVTFRLRETSIGKAWSTLRVEILQRAKVCASSDIIISNLLVTGITLATSWRLTPSPHSVDLSKLETDSDPNWTCHHLAFHPHGFRRGHAYMKNFIPSRLPQKVAYAEQWIAPGWDCKPTGSRDPSKPEARWTNAMIQFVADMMIPMGENLIPSKPGQPDPHASIAATLKYATTQKRAREEGRPNWRELDHDGSVNFTAHLLHVTLTMCTEAKKKLPDEGVRWLYHRTQARSIVNGRMDLEVLTCDEQMGLVAICNQTAQIIPAMVKSQRKASL